MSSSFFDPDWTAKVTLPVKRVGERWEFFYGGDIPVREGPLGELTLSAEQITDDSFKRRVTQEAVVRILDEGSELRIALSDRGTFGGLHGYWPTPRRISHTGNIHARVFYQEPSGSWYPLDDLRQGVLVDAERELLKSTWAEVERKLGWRPPPPSSSKKKR